MDLYGQEIQEKKKDPQNKPPKIKKMAIGTYISIGSVQFSSVAQSCPTLCNPMNHRTPGLPVIYMSIYQ